MEQFIGAIILITAILGISLYGIYILVSKFYIKVPPNKAAIIYGRQHEIKDPNTGERRERGFRIVKGGATLLIPILEGVEYLDLSNRKIDLIVEDIRAANGVKVDVDAVAIVRFGTDESSIETAAEQFGNMDQAATDQKVQDILDKTLEGHFRTIISTMTPEDLFLNREKFSQEVQKSAGQPLNEMGIKIVDFTIKRVDDKEEYLNNLGVGPLVDEKRKAEIARSIAEKDIKEQQAEDKAKIRTAIEKQAVEEERSKGREEIEQIQVLERSKIAKIESEIAKVKSEIEHTTKLIELQKQQDELELIKVKLEQKKKIFQAAGDEQAARRKALEIENLAKANAEAIRMHAEAEAEGKRLVAEAYKQLDPTAKMLLIIEKLPEVLKAFLGEEGLARVFGEIAKPIGNIDSIKIYDFGGGNGNGNAGPIDRFANTAPQMLMGMVSKLNDMGFGDFLQKIGLTSDMLDDMGSKQLPENNSKEQDDSVKIKEGVTVKTVEQQTTENSKKVAEETVEFEEIKTGDTIELDIKTNSKKKDKK